MLGGRYRLFHTFDIGAFARVLAWVFIELSGVRDEHQPGALLRNTAIFLIAADVIAISAAWIGGR